MKISEVITGPAYDTYIDNYLMYFVNAPIIDSNNGLNLKQSMHNDELMYGLFDPENTIVGLFVLLRYNDKYWQVMLSQIEQQYKGQGFGTYLYDYAIMNDRLSILSDSHQTENTDGSSWQLWCRLYRYGRYNVYSYDLNSDTVIPDVTPTTIASQTDNIVWLATPKGERIHEMLNRINKSSNRVSAAYRQIKWYGPDTLTSNKENY